MQTLYVNIIIYLKQCKRLQRLTVSSSETPVAFITVPFLLLGSSGSVGQSAAPPTICPGIAVPRTVPSTSTIIPESNTEIERQFLKDNSHVKAFDLTGELTYGKQWQSPSPSGCCWWTWWELSMAHGSTANVHKHKVRLVYTLGPRGEKYSRVSTIHTNRLHWLEEAVKDQIPDDLPLLERRHVPD